jgi:hypothetical protein
VRESTAAAKALSDNAEISLQNLLYEKEHYKNEIKACQSFRHAPNPHLLQIMQFVRPLMSDPAPVKHI